MSPTTVLVLLVAILQGSWCLDRDAVVAEYEPQLVELDAKFADEYDGVSTEKGLILEQIQNDTVTAIALMNTQISTLKTTITTAKALADKNNKTEVSYCIAVQEAAAAQLTAAPLNTSCWVDADFPELVDATDALRVLGTIPNITISACSELDPLYTQDELFQSCIIDKIADLDKQISLLRTSFDGVRESTIANSVQCLTDQTSLLVQDINNINLQVALCQ